jgi:hypothetical protein
LIKVPDGDNLQNVVPLGDTEANKENDNDDSDDGNL